MAYSAAEFEAAALNALANYPSVAALVQAGDPRVLAQIRAQAAMLAMMSAQVDVAQYEPFLKARDATVLADAAMKGILPLSRAAKVTLSAVNGSASTYTLPVGRRIMDAKGRIYMVDSSVTIPAGGTASVSCSQRTTRTISHTVAADQPFYLIEVAQTDEAVYLNSLEVWWMRLPTSVQLTYAPDWFNVKPGDTCYQVEADESRRMWVQMGSRDVVGTQFAIGDVIELRISESAGVIDDLTVGATLQLEYTYTQADSTLVLTLASVDDIGAEPPTVAELRVMSRYPSIYDHNAVYLGEFGMLLRRYIGGIRFLAVWNEQIEEAARGASVNNINTLFVSGIVTGMTDPVFQQKVSDLIARADTSYKLKFVAASQVAIPCVVNASVAAVHDRSAVAAQIKALLLDTYGEGKSAVSEGLRNPPRTQGVTKLLRDGITALQDDQSDFTVSLSLPSTPLPERYVYMTSASVTVNVTNADYSTGLWSL